METILNKFDPYAALIGRILLSLIFIATGAGKLAGDPAATIGYMESVGVPGFLFWPSTLFELFAGIAILVGYKRESQPFYWQASAWSLRRFFTATLQIRYKCICS